MDRGNAPAPTPNSTLSPVWTDLLATLARQPSRGRRVSSLVSMAERLAVLPRWGAMVPSWIGGELWLAPLPRSAWSRGLPKVSIRYVVSADRFRGMFTRHGEQAQSIYACTDSDLPVKLEEGWRKLSDRPRFGENRDTGRLSSETGLGEG